MKPFISRNIILILLSLFVGIYMSSCSSDNVEQKKNSYDIRPHTTDQQDFTSDLKYKGKIVYSTKWDDLNGKNVFIYSKNGKDYESVSIYGYHYIKPEGSSGYKLLREVKDWIDSCELDLTYDLYENEITVTDVDGDHYGEVTMMYSLECSGDVSPKPLKLLIIENGEKSAIRGSIQAWIGGMYGGEKNLDFKPYDEKLKNYALSRWDKVVNPEVKKQLEYALNEKRSELQAAELMVDEIKNRVLVTKTRKEEQLKEQFQKIEDLKTEINQLEKEYNQLLIDIN